MMNRFFKAAAVLALCALFAALCSCAPQKTGISFVGAGAHNSSLPASASAGGAEGSSERQETSAAPAQTPTSTLTPTPSVSASDTTTRTHTQTSGDPAAPSSGAESSLTQSGALETDEPSDETAAQTTKEKETILHLVSVTSPVPKNGKAVLTASGKPDTEYTIEVYYSSGKSTSKDLVPKVSDNDGQVTWTWHVGGKTAEGRHRIVISGGDEKIETFFETT